MSELAKWGTFYAIVGSAAGALIGLQFVVVTLVAERPSLRTAMAGASFATPNIVHFGTVLLLSVLLHVPWQTIIIAAVLWGVTGFSGAVYMVIVARRLRVQTVYQMEFEDWLFLVMMPLAAHTILILSALAVSSHVYEALLGVAGATLLLLFIGIHNAWDSIAYHVFVNKPDTDRKDV
ncbi:MAG TPA: hypothetical protein VMT12_15430 [Syntrophales bacterium]|nr:hypothetical protein [Syntrophales bacterium]